MRHLVRKLSRAEKREEGCYLSAEMVRWLLTEGTVLHRMVQDYRTLPRSTYIPKKYRGRPATVMTNKLIAEIRRMKELGMRNREIAAQLDLSLATVQKYSTDKNIAVSKERELERYARERLDPVRVEARRKTAREYAKGLAERNKAA